MSDIAVRVEHLSKAYRIAHNQSRGRYKTLQEEVVGLLKRPFSRNSSVSSTEEFWALKDVSFEVKQGEVLGIIGRNGAGKSTLLKILSRITRPTVGYAEMTGRVGSLLEVGTGFHPELTGRENVFLNGAVLGMSRYDIRRRFEEIIEFAGVEQFLDTPVKRYSSGMYMRLAFAVAAHLEPEILVVDEVLAVGDAEFQKKSLGKMDQVAQSGRTVLFVSHNMPAITRICTRAILLDKSRLAAQGSATEMAALYFNSGPITSAAREWRDERVDEHAVLFPRGLYVRNAANELSYTFGIDERIRICIHYEVCQEGYQVVPTIRLTNDSGQVVFTNFDSAISSYAQPRPVGAYETMVDIPAHFLNEGAYSVLLSINAGLPLKSYVYEPDAVAFQVVENATAEPLRAYYEGPILGVTRPKLTWSTHGPL